MSSSNQVRIAAIEETTYGETPGAGDFSTARFTSESLSGTPETTVSQQIRTDRQSSGQVVTGLTVGGDISGELAKEDMLDEFIESAMFSTFAADTPITIDLDIDTVAGTITRDSGDFNNDVAVGDVVSLTGCSNAVNNTEVFVAGITSALIITYVGPTTMVDETGSGNGFSVADKIEIGTTKKSFSMEKAFLDLTTKALIYKGMIASNMNMNATHGDIVSYSFSFSGNDYENADAAGEFITNSRTIDPAATTQSMNGSIDMSILGESSGGTFDLASFCIQSVQMSLNNNLTARTCLGAAPPQGYSEGTAEVEVSLEAYLSDSDWALLEKKLSQESFALGFIIKNDDGFYGFYFPAIQVTFDDPASGGSNQDVMLSMTGVAKVGAASEKSLRMFRG